MTVARRAAVFALGAALLVAAVYAVFRQSAAIDHAWAAARGQPAWMIALVLSLPLVNLLLVAASFRVLTGRYGRVGAGEMLALIASAWLLNNLPLRPGLLGRVAYHKAVNGIPVTDSVKVLLSAIGCAGVGMLALMAVVLGVWRTHLDAVWIVPVFAAPAALLACAGLVFGLRAPVGGAGNAWRWPIAIALRYVDVLVWTIRYWVIFRMLGYPLGFMGCTAVSLSSQAAMLFPVQIGFREWVVGVVGALLPDAAWLVPASGSPAASGTLGGELAPGLLVDMVNRAAEIAGAIPVGLLATWWLWNRWKRVPPPNTAESRPQP